MSPEQVRSAQPRQPTPPPPRRGSTIPDQIYQDPRYDHKRSPKSSLPEFREPDSPTQKRGPGIPRNPVADTWREDAYVKERPSKRRLSIVEAGKMQDRWRCEYCNQMNEGSTGVTTVTTTPTRTTPHETEITITTVSQKSTTTITTPQSDDPRVGTTGPSRV